MDLIAAHFAVEEFAVGFEASKDRHGYNGFATIPKIVAHGLLLANGEGALFSREPECARRAAVQIERALQFYIRHEALRREQCRQLRERQVRGVTERGAIPSACSDECPARRARVIQSGDCLAAVDQERAALPRLVGFVFAENSAER